MRHSRKHGLLELGGGHVGELVDANGVAVLIGASVVGAAAQDGTRIRVSSKTAIL